MRDTVLRYRGIGFPDEFYTDLVYVKSTVYSTSAVVGYQLQSSLFDPDPAVGGTQPTFFDQLAAVYGRYQVMAMTAEVEVPVWGDLPLSLAHAWTDENPTYSTVDELAMFRYSAARTAVPFAAPTRWVTTMSMGKLHGYPDIRQEESLSALVNTNPTDVGFFTVAAVSSNGATATSALIRIKMTYHARFFALVTPTPS